MIDMEYNRSYSELTTITDFGDRMDYLCLVGEKHPSPRSISESFYKHPVWLATRKNIITRDFGCDLGIIGEDIFDIILVHHINPINESDIENWNPCLFDPENLITTSVTTHNHIHYGIPVIESIVERKAGDTTLWKTHNR